MSVKVAEGAPGVGVSITANIGSDRQIVLQGFYARGDKAEGDALIADMNGRIDAMKAPHELRRLEEDLRKARDGLANMRKNLAKLDENAQREQAERVVGLEAAKQAVLTYEEEIAAADKKARTDWSRKGKEGDYIEGNHVTQMRQRHKTNLENYAELERRIDEEARKHESEKAVAAEQCNINIARFEREIVQLEADLDRQRELLPAGG